MRKILLAGSTALMSLTLALPALADYSSTVSSFNPAAYWRLNETTPVPAADVATNSGTFGYAGMGYYVSGAQHSVFGPLAGTQDTAALFPDAAGNRMKVPFLKELAVSGPFSVEFWANPNALASGDSGTMCPVAFTQFGDAPDFSSSFRAGWLFYQNAGSGWTFRLYGPGSAGFNAISSGGVTAGQWYHIVGVYDGANVILYVDGVQAASVAGPAVNAPVPSEVIPFSVGARADGQLGFFRYNGIVDEVAYYTNVLTAAEVKAHHDNGLNASRTTPYDQLVLAKNPALYFRLDEPYYLDPDPTTLPYATNSGSLGSAADGQVFPGLYSAVAGPPYTGLGAGNLAYDFSGVAGKIDCGTPAGLNISGPLTVMAWLKIKDFDKTWESIVTKGDNSWRVHRNGNSQNLGFGTTGVTNSAGSVDQAGSRILNDGQWHHIAAVYDGSTKYLYVDSILDSSVAVSGTLAQNTYSVLIGENAQVTGRQFNGTLDEVAIFTTALTAAQIQQIYLSANVSPTIIQQPQAPAGQIIAGAPVSLQVVAVGNPILTYQWLRSGTNLAGQTASALSFSNITTNDAGSYSVIVNNPYGSVTSSIVALSVTYPTSPAGLVNTFGFPAYDSVSRVASLTRVILEFSGPLSSEGGNPSHYSIPGLNVTAASFTNLNTTVILTTSPQTQGAVYNITITGVTDGIGNPLAANTGQFRAWVTTPLNGVWYEYYPGDNTATAAETSVAALLGNSEYPDHPVFGMSIWAMDSRIVFPNDVQERYGARMRTLFVPAQTAKYRFYLRSDDASRVFLNPNGSDPAGKVMILDETGCCGDWSKFESAAYQLVGGQPYYLEMLYKEGGGGDYGKVAVRLDGTGYPAVGTPNSAIDPASIAGPSVCYPYAPADAAGALVLTGPADTSIKAYHATNFTVAASNPGKWPMSYQWFRGADPINGATNSTYAIVPTPADNGVRFSVQVSRLGAVVHSAEALLTVTANTDTPAVAGVHGANVFSNAVVSFSQVIATPSINSFSIQGFTTLSAVLDATGTNVILTFDHALTPGQSYTLNVQNVVDASGNTLASAQTTLKTFVFSRGLLQFDFWPGLAMTNNSILTFLNDPRFPTAPEWTGFLTAMDSRTIFPDDSHASYGDLIRGYFVPPTTGNYIFYLRSDDSSQFYFNPFGSDPIAVPFDGLTLPLIEETGCCGAFSKLPSTTQTLTANNLYAIASVHKEGNGGDYVQVAAKLDTDPTAPDALSPIPGSQIGIFADPVGASLTITRQPVNTIGAYVGARLQGDFNSNDGGFSVFNYGNPTGPWHYNAAAGSWTNFGPGGCGGPFGTGLRSPRLVVQNTDTIVLTFSHRYSFEFDTGANYDGGQVRLSVNGGPFATVAPANFTQNGYGGSIGGTISGAISSSPGWINQAFVKESAGFGTRTFITSTAGLGAFNPGDTIQLEFVASWDECSEGNEPNWEIDSVQLSGGNLVLASVVSLNVAVESTYLGKPNPYISYFWQMETPGGFVDIPGANQPSLVFYASLNDSGGRYRCTLYSPGASATTDVATVTVTLPLNYARTAPGSLTLSWPLPPPPLTSTTFVLEQSPNLVPGVWTAVPPSQYVVTADNVSATVTISSAGPGQFFRLRRN